MNVLSDAPGVKRPSDCYPVEASQPSYFVLITTSSRYFSGMCQ